MPVRETSLMALEEVQKRLAPDQWAIYQLLSEIGPAPDIRIKEALNQKEQRTLKSARFKRKWEINQVTARRNELASRKLNLVRDIGTYSGIWNNKKKTYHFWAVQEDDRQPAGWKRLPDKPHVEARNKCIGCPFKHEHIQKETEKRIENRMQKTGSTIQATKDKTLFEMKV